MSRRIRPSRRQARISCAAPPEKRTSFNVVFEDAKGVNSSETNRDVAVGTVIDEAYAASSTARWKNPNGWTLVGWEPSLPQTVTCDLTLTAQWISISEVLDCTNLTFNTDYSSKWVPTEDGKAEGGSCMRMDESNGEDVLYTDIDTAGILHFRWKGGAGCKLTVKIDTEQDQTNFTAVAGMPWTLVDMEIKEPCRVEFACTKQNFKDFCALDHVIWEPGVKPKHVVTYLPGQGVTGSLATQTADRDVPITLGGDGSFQRPGYLQIGWAIVEGGAKAFDFCEAYTGDSITLYPAWKMDVGDFSRALDCDNLTFEAEDGWVIYTDAAAGKEFAKKGGSCMRTETANAKITATVKTPGTLTFCWKGQGSKYEATWFCVSLGKEDDVWEDSVKLPEKEWTSSDVKKEIKVQQSDLPCTITFSCVSIGSDGYCALDYVTWVPEQTHPEPGPGDEVEISSVSVSEGKFTLSFQSDDRFDYNLLTNANLLIDSWGVWGVKPGDGKTLLFEPPILPGEPQMFYKVETIQRKE